MTDVDACVKESMKNLFYCKAEWVIECEMTVIIFKNSSKLFFKENVGVQMPDICKSQEKYCWLTKTEVLKNNLQAQYLKNAEIIWNKSKQRDIKNWKDLSQGYGEHIHWRNFWWDKMIKRIE